MERLLPSSSAKAKLPPKHIRASAKAIASNGRIRFIIDPQSRFRLPENASPDAAEFSTPRDICVPSNPLFPCEEGHFDWIVADIGLVRNGRIYEPTSLYIKKKGMRTKEVGLRAMFLD